MVADWLDAINEKDTGKKREKLQGFINSALAEFWEQVEVSKSDAEVLRARCELVPQMIPETSVALNLSIDNQKHEKWYGIRAWANDYDSWLIDYNRISTFDNLKDMILDAIYPVRNSDRHMGFWRIALDTGGGRKYEDASMTEEAYFWIMEMRKLGVEVFATKGASTPIAGNILKVGSPLLKTPSGKAIPGGIPIVSLDTDKLKDMFHASLANAIEGRPRGAYLHKDTGREYATQISAEHKVTNNKGIITWEVQGGQPNHALDVECGHVAMASPFWPGGGVNLLAGPLYEYVEDENKKTKPKKQGRAKRW
jgi:phage terminase large subunit GpA-like protein